MLEIIKEAGDNAIPQMTIVGSKNAPLAKKSGSKITGTAVPFELAHPRYPKNAASGKGGEFMEKGSTDYKMAVANNLVQAVKQGKMPLENAQKAAKDLGIANQPKAYDFSQDDLFLSSEVKPAKSTKLSKQVESQKSKQNMLRKPVEQPKQIAQKKDESISQPATLEQSFKQKESELLNAKSKYFEAKSKYSEALDFGKSQNLLKKLREEMLASKAKMSTIQDEYWDIKDKYHEEKAKPLKEIAKKEAEIKAKGTSLEYLLAKTKNKWEQVAPTEYIKGMKWSLPQEYREEFIKTLDKSLAGEVSSKSKWLNPKDINPNAPPPTEQQVRDIWAYTGTSTCQSMNGSLRGVFQDNELESKAIQMAERTSNALKALPDYKGTVYRGTLLPLDIAEKLEVGATYADPGFLSTSTSMDVASGFADTSSAGQVQVIFQIEGKHQGKNVDPISAFKGKEKEILFAPNSHFKITKISTHKDYPLIHLEQIKTPRTKLSSVSTKAKKEIKSRQKAIADRFNVSPS